MSQQSQSPIKVFRGGRGVDVAIWRNEVERNGKTVINHSLRIQNRYKDKEGNWKSTDYLSLEEAFRAREVLDEAIRWLTVTDRDEETEFPIVD